MASCSCQGRPIKTDENRICYKGQRPTANLSIHMIRCARANDIEYMSQFFFMSTLKRNEFPY